jgi:beta-lactamase class A
MGLFGKREKSEEELEDEMIEEEDELRKTRKKLRDLSPENKRNRKEPVKPWTKADRYLVGGVFVGTILTALILFAISTDWKLPGFSKIKFPTLQSGEVVITANKVDREKAQKIKDEINIESEKMNAASLMKLPVLLALYDASDKGEINLDEEYTLSNSDKADGSGSLRNRPAGTKITYRKLAEFMGKESDNTAMKIVTAKVGEQKIVDMIRKVGMINTDYPKWETTAEDVAELYKKLYNDQLVNKKSKEEILSYLTNTIYEEMIPMNVGGLKVAHKFGRELHIIHDGGIVYADKPYVLVVMSKGIIDNEGLLFIPQIVSKIHLGIGN